MSQNNRAVDQPIAWLLDLLRQSEIPITILVFTDLGRLNSLLPPSLPKLGMAMLSAQGDGYG